MTDKEKVNNIMAEAMDIVVTAGDVVEDANEIVDAAEGVGKKAGGLLTRLKNLFIGIFAYFKNLFKKD